MTAPEEFEARFLVSEYEQLLEEIREAGRSSWAPWTAYLAASAYLLGTLRALDVFAAMASLAMVALGFLVVLYVYKLRRQNNLNYARLWEIEERFRTISHSNRVGARWNPRAWPRLEALLGYRRNFLGLIDFMLILITTLLACAWAVFGSVAVFKLDVNALDVEWLVVLSGFPLVVLWAEICWWWWVTRSEKRAHERWRSNHPQE